MKWLLGRFHHAFAGIRHAAVHDRSVRFQLLLGIVALAAGFVFQIAASEWLWIVLSIFLVVICEIFNSCIEKTVDYISLDISEQARNIKDMSAGAVFLAACFAFYCALMIFGPRIYLLIYS